MLTAIIFIAILSLLVVVHEFGHFITARLSGMRVHEFGIGFPPRLFGVYKNSRTKKFVFFWGRGKRRQRSKVKGQRSAVETVEETLLDGESEDAFTATVYSLNCLPLGGFCKIKGENGEQELEKDSFGHQKVWKRMVVLVAGVVMNILLAGVLLGIGFGIGLPADFSGGADPKAIIVEQPNVTIEQVEDKSPAQEAGLQFGDRVISMNGTPIATASEMIEFTKRHGNEAIRIIVSRAGKETSVMVTPRVLTSAPDRPRIGAMLADAGVIRYPWHIAIPRGFVAAGVGFVNVFITFYYVLKEFFSGHGLVMDVSGPVGIAVVVGQSARLGINYLLNVTAMISLSLAAMNILPIPALDGGRALFVLIGKIFRRPVPMRYEQLAHTIGFVLLLMLIVAVTGRDVARLF